jgi:hypothetical protein
MPARARSPATEEGPRPRRRSGRLAIAWLALATFHRAASGAMLDDLSLHVETPFTSDPAALARAIDAAEGRPARGDESDRTRAIALDTMLELQKSETLAGDPCSHLVTSPVEAFAATTRQEARRCALSAT